MASTASIRAPSAVGAVLDTLDGVVGGVVARAAEAASPSPEISGLGGTGASISIPGMGSTLPGLSVDVNLSLSPPLDPTGRFPDPVPPSIPTNPTLPGGSAGIRHRRRLGETPHEPADSLDETGGSRPRRRLRLANATPRRQGEPGRQPPGAACDVDRIDAGQPTQGDGHATEAQAASFAPNAGSAAISAAASSTTASSVSATTSGLAGVVGDEARSRSEVVSDDAPVLAGPSSAGPELSARPDIAPAELLPGDLEGLERALGQLMRRFDEHGRGSGRVAHAIQHARDALGGGDGGPGLRGHPSVGAPETTRESPSPDRIFQPARPVLSPEGVSVRAAGPGAIAGGSAIF